MSDISAGAAHTCARTRNNDVWCWGGDALGQLGDGDDSLQEQQAVAAGETYVGSPLPVPVVALDGRRVVALAAGDSHECAVLGNGSAHCWGDDGFGQVGNAQGRGGVVTSPDRVRNLP